VQPQLQPNSRLGSRGRFPTPAIDRLLAGCVVDAETGCWVWQRAKNAKGYGRVLIGSRVDGTRRVVYAHRLSYELHVGPVPDGLDLDHLCRNTSCCNPAHLEPVTRRENVLRGEAPAAKQWRLGECNRGHAFTPENTYVNKGKRYCRTCQRARMAAYLKRKAALAEH
jgi:hypothetical protein